MLATRAHSVGPSWRRLGERTCRLEARVQVLEQHGAARDRPAEAEKVPDGVEDDEGAEDVNVECTYTLNPSVRNLIIENTDSFRIYQCVETIRTRWRETSGDSRGVSRTEEGWILYHFETRQD